MSTTSYRYATKRRQALLAPAPAAKTKAEPALSPSLRQTLIMIQANQSVNQINQAIADTAIIDNEILAQFPDITNLDGTITIPSDTTVTVTSLNFLRTITAGNYPGPMFEVANNGHLIIGDIIINGGGTARNGTIVALQGANSSLIVTGDAVLQNNHNTENGGAIIMAPGSTVDVQSGAQILGNTSDKSGGAIYVPYANLSNVNVASGARFEYNQAAGALRSRRAADNATYDANIGQNVTWSSNATQGYNNWDIAYPAASGGGGGGSGGGGGGYMPGRNNGYVTWGSSTVSSAPAATPPSTPAAPVGRKICATVCLHVL